MPMPHYKAPNPRGATFDAPSRPGSSEGEQPAQVAERLGECVDRKHGAGERRAGSEERGEALQSCEGQRGRPKEEVPG
jgi:hypothetical protein